jgi:DEAD/DEAH box helicase domain-containing protein
MSAIQISEVLAALRSRLAAEAIRTAFHPTTPGFRGLIDRFLADRERLFKGPYVSVALPFPPYLHQEKAFDRLLPGTPRNTLVATGTGSGKTECFLLPLLEHCRQQQAQGLRGIKAILIYPMNALATDQARRIADLIHTIPALAGLRAGLYIGASDDAPTAAMSATSVITDKGALQKYPPDILLTNYKQLDYLLIQPQVQGLWEQNGHLPDGTSVLRYLVVDEFHSFDGAQGTDLACLIFASHFEPGSLPLRGHARCGFLCDAPHRHKGHSRTWSVAAASGYAGKTHRDRRLKR